MSESSTQTAGRADWPMRGYNLRGAARTPAVGQIREPRLAWQANLSVREILLIATPRLGQSVWEPSASPDLNPLSADARREALCYPSEYSVVKGNTGEQYLVESTGPLKGTNNFWVIGGLPLVADLDGDGQLETLWTSPSIILAWTQPQGCDDQAGTEARPYLLWRTEPNDGAAGQPALGDTDGDGRVEIGLPGFRDGFRCLDPATGQARWTVPPQGDGASNCVAADVNGDGVEEFVYANGSRLLAVAPRPGAASPILWQIDLPAPIRDVVVADVDGDGQAEILAGSSDGVLYTVE